MKSITKCWLVFIFWVLNYVSYSQNTQHSCGADNVHNPAINYGTVTDIDSNIYKTVVIGNQVWMAENLKTSRFLNGDLIPTFASNIDWSNVYNSKIGASCWYNNDSANYNCPYGKLYNWHVVNDIRKLCPLGWYVPTDLEWLQLVNFIDPDGGGVNGGNTGGDLLKSTGLQYWLNNSSLFSNNSKGFSAIATGLRGNDGIFSNFGLGAGFWTSTEANLTNQVYYNALRNIGTGIVFTYGPKETGLCIRCLKDATNATLPVTWQFFKVEKTRDDVNLIWQTTNEFNTNYFNVQHSTTGVTWQNIGKVYAGNGTYSFLHTTPANGYNFYRLQQVDKDGKTSFSSIKQVSLNTYKNDVVKVYPNPIESWSIVVAFSNINLVQSSYKITDVLGKILQTGKLTSFTNIIKLPSLKAGIYFIKLDNGFIKKIVK